MGNFQFNITKGDIKTKFLSVGGVVELIAVPCVGTVTDANLVDLDTLTAVLGTALDEHATMGREPASGVTATVDDANDCCTLTIDPITWVAPAANGTPTTRLLFCYDSDTGSGTDANIIPLLCYDFVATTDGNDIVVSPHANGLIRIT